MQNGKVPMFKMKPHGGTLWMSIIVLLLGVMTYFEGHGDPGDISAHEKSNLVLMISVVVSGGLMIISTSRMWFKHLWHDRYGRR